VDYDADVVSTFQMILEMNGFEVEAYTSPTSALSNFKPNEFGLLILDIRMPVMNGFELFKRIKSIQANSRTHNECFQSKDSIRMNTSVQGFADV
jgi:FixJ family two-component response regulator